MLYESKTFRLEADDQVLTLWLDFSGRACHTLTLARLHELNLVLDRIAALPVPDVLVLRSSSPTSFLEEFDGVELCRFSSALEFAALARRGQEVTRKLAGLACTTLAVIEGRCAGAGLEIALACHYRLAVDSAATRFESPDVSRGLIPFWGGTWRLPRLVGTRAALSLLRDGKAFAAPAARHIRLVDRITAPDRASIDLPAMVDRLRDEPAGTPKRSFWRGLATLLTPLRTTFSKPGIPTNAAGSAAAELLTAVSSGYSSESDGLAAERAAIARLATSEPTRRLLELHRQSVAPVRVVPEPINPISPIPRRIGIVGTSELANLLACRFARFGHDVVVQEGCAGEAERFGRSVTKHLTRWTRRGEVTATEAKRIHHAIGVTSDWVGFDNAELVIESAIEDAGVKRNVFQELESRVRPRVPLVTASSSVSVEAIQAEMTRPNRIGGLAFPNPLERAPLAEVVGTSLTEPAVVCSLMQWARKWGFTPIRVADRPGRLVDLIRLTYLAEGVTLVAEGQSIDRIDAGCRRFGMKRGPLEWCDEIGLDRLAERVAHLQLSRGDNFGRCLLFQRLLPYGCVGRSVGEGFYRYGLRRTPSRLTRMVLWQDLDEDAIAPYVFEPDAASEEGIDRIVLRTVNEAASALADEPDADPATVDLALAYGMGWAPHLGGPLRYADGLGLSAVVDRLALFAERFGPRFTPCDELVRRAEAGEAFYDGTTTEAEAAVWRMVG